MNSFKANLKKNVENGSKNRSLGLIFAIMLMDVIGITILNPVAPYIVRRFSDSALMISMVTMIYSAGQFIAAPLMGKLGDRYGRRPILIISILGQGLGYFIFGLGGGLWVLFLGRLIGGITGGNLSTATAYLADISEPQERSKNFALIGMAWSLGLITGPAAGGMLGRFGLETPAFVAASLSLLNALLCIAVLSESLPKERRKKTAMRANDLNPIFSIFELAQKHGLGGLLIVISMFNLAFNGINSTSAVFLIQKFDAQLWHVSAMTIAAGVSITITNFFLVPKWVKRYGEKVTAIGSLMGQAAINLLIFCTPVLWAIFPLTMMTAAMSAFTFPTLTTLSTELVPFREIGLLMGVTTGLGSLMNVFGPFWAGGAYDHIMMGAPYWLGAIILLFAGIFLIILKRATTHEVT